MKPQARLDQGELPEEILSLPIAGVGLRARTLGPELGSETTLLVFLRHFG